MDYHDIWILICVPNFSSLTWIEVCQEPPVLEVILGGRWRFLTGYLEDGVILDIMDRHDMWILTCLPNFSSLAWIEVCQEPPVLEVILGGRWWFLTGDLEDGVILDVMDRHDMWILTCVPNFSSLAWLEVCQEPPVLEVILGGRWWFLTGDFEDGVILDMLVHLGRPPGSYPESFVKIWLHLAEIWRCVSPKHLNI